MKLGDIISVETEHLLGAATGKPLVKLRVIGADVILVDTLTVEDTRAVALCMLESAARAEYEHDFWSASFSAGVGEADIAAMLSLVRQGEVARHVGLDETDGS